MASTFLGMNTALSGMMTYMGQLNTTAHNIANIGTDGYSKQSCVQSATKAISFGTTYGMQGTGVQVTDVVSSRNVYYDTKYRTECSKYGRYSTLSYYMQSIEDYFYSPDTDTGGITNSLDGFFLMLEELTTDPSDETIRQSVVGYAELFTSYVEETADALLQLQKDANDQIAQVVDQINAYAEEIASLTKQINTLEAYGVAANDLRDQRALLLDELSELVDIQVTEVIPEDKQGLTQFIVTIDGMTLVDTYDYYTIECVAKETANNQTDAEGLYDLVWSNGIDFDESANVGGTLQALLEIRDGNNGDVFTGSVTGTETTTSADGTTTSTITVTGVNSIATSIFELNIPETDGVISIGSARYQYESFTCTISEDGTYTYTFTLKEGVTLGSNIEEGDTVTIGDSVDYRGIPYYMSQLTEFIRTFSYYFNEVQTSGYDLNGNQGEELFVAFDRMTGEEMTLYFEFDANGEYTFDTASLDSSSASYYYLTCINTKAADALVADGSLLACSDSDEEGVVANGGNLEKMVALQDDKTMFAQGTPAGFLESLTAVVGMDSAKAQTNALNAENLKLSVDMRRQSVSGVDEDEEAQNLIVWQNLLNYQYKVLSVMDEVLDKLINDTAV